MTLPSESNDGSGSPTGRAVRATGVTAALCAALAAALTLGCDPYVQGNGVYREETRNVGAFHGVAIADGLGATVRAGLEARLVVTGDENVLQYVETKVDGDGVLWARVADHVPYDSVHPIRILVDAPTIDTLLAQEGSVVNASGLADDSLWTEATDGGELVVTAADGATPSMLHVVLHGGQRGGGHLDARGYPVQDAVVDVSGGARAELRVAGTISGTARDGVVENLGAGTCNVVLLEGATCGPPSP